MKHTMRLQRAPFNLIKSGVKTIELRLYDDKRKKLSVGDEIEFVSVDGSEERLVADIVELHLFSSFDELYAALPLLKCGYTEDDISTAAPSDMELYYSKEEQAMYGVIGIEIKLK